MIGAWDFPARLLFNLLHFLTKGEPEGAAAEFVEFVLSDAVQSSVVGEAGFVPVVREGD